MLRRLLFLRWRHPPIPRLNDRSSRSFDIDSRSFAPSACTITSRKCRCRRKRHVGRSVGIGSPSFKIEGFHITIYRSGEFESLTVFGPSPGKSAAPLRFFELGSKPALTAARAETLARKLSDRVDRSNIPTHDPREGEWP